MLLFSVLIFSATQGGSGALQQDDSTTFKAGDTIFYKITIWDSPSLLRIPLDNTTTLDANLDLEGSTIALKILSVDDDGYYLGAYGSLNKIGSISVSSDAGLLTLPIPVGLSGPFLTQSYFSFEPWNQNQGFNLPFWMKNVDWDSLNTWASNNNNLAFTETEDNATLTAQIQDLMIELLWEKSGEDVFFEKLSVEGSVNITENESENIKLVLEKQSVEKRPLSPELDTGDILKYEVVKSDFEFNLILNELAENILDPIIEDQTDGRFDSIQSILNDIEANLTSLNGQIITEYEITDIDGVFYNASVSQYNMTSQTLGAKNAISVNGFTGTPNLQSTINIGPSVVLTPDWDMWEGLVDQTDNLQTLVSLFSGEQAGDDLTGLYRDFGFTDGPNFAFGSSWQDDNNIVYSGFTSFTDFKWDLSLISPDLVNLSQISDLLSLDIPLFTSQFSVFQSYTQDGIFIGSGFSTLTSISFNASINPSTLLGENSSAFFDINIPIQGDFVVDIDFEIRLSDQSVGVSNAVNTALGIDSQDFFANLPIFEIGAATGLIGIGAIVTLVYTRYFSKP